MYQRTHSGKQYLENWKIFQNEKSLQTCITQILIEQWTVGGVSHDGCCWHWSQGLVNLKQYLCMYYLSLAVYAPSCCLVRVREQPSFRHLLDALGHDMGLILVDTLILLSIFDLVPQTQIYGLSRILSFSVSSVNLLSLRCEL